MKSCWKFVYENTKVANTVDQMCNSFYLRVKLSIVHILTVSIYHAYSPQKKTVKRSICLLKCDTHQQNTPSALKLISTLS